MKTRQEALGDAGAVEALRQVMLQRLGSPRAQACVIQFGARSADNAELVGEQAVGIEAVQRRQQHPAREIAGCAEQDQGRNPLRHGQAICGASACF